MARNNQSKKKNGAVKKQSSGQVARRDESRSDLARRDPQLLATPFAFMRRFSEDMDRMFEDFGFGRGLLAPGLDRGLDQLGTLAGTAWAPQVEVQERDNELIIRADLPGMAKDDINVDLDDNSLIIRGERRSEREEDEEGYYRSERSYGSFYRRIPLPVGVKTEEANAEFTNGVLEITIPAAAKRSEAKNRQLEIRGEGSRSQAKAAGQR